MKREKKNFTRFNMPIRVIALILAIAFLWQDIVWAHPDVFKINKDTLAQTTVITDKDKARAFQRVASIYITSLIKRQKPEKRITLSDVEKQLDEIKKIALARELKTKDLPEVINNIYDGRIRLRFASGDELIFYNPEASSVLFQKNIPPTGKNIAYDIEINKYLHAKFLIENAQNNSPTFFSADTPGAGARSVVWKRFGKIGNKTAKDKKLQEQGYRYYMLQHGEPKYSHFRCNIFTSLNDQIIGNIKEREWLTKALKSIKDIQDIFEVAKGVKQDISRQDGTNIEKILKQIFKVIGSAHVRLPDKQRAAGYIKAAIADYKAGEFQDMRNSYRNLSRAVKSLTARKEEAENIYEGLRKILKNARSWAEEENTYMAGLAERGETESLHKLANRDEVKAPENEPGFEGLESLIRQAIRDAAKRDKNLKRVADKIKEVNFLNRIIAGFEDAYFDARYMGGDEPYLREKLFQEKWLEYFSESNISRGSPAWWYARFYQAVFIHRTIPNPEKPSERISNPLFEASTALIQILKIQRFDSILKARSLLSKKSFPKTRAVIESFKKVSLYKLSQKEKRGIIRTLAREKNLGQKGLVELNKCAEVFLAPKPRGVGAAYYNDAAFDEPSEKENRLEAEQSHWSESTRKAFERVKKLKALARPEKVRKDPHYFALTEDEWERLIQVKPEAYIRKSGECARGKPSLQEVVAFELETGKQILRGGYIGKNMGKKLREHSQKTPVAVSTHTMANSQMGAGNIDFICLPIKFKQRFGIKVFKHGLVVAGRLLAEKDKPEAYIDILRDAKTALVTGFRIKEGNSPPFIHHIRRLYRPVSKKKALLITKMYANNFISMIENMSAEKPLMVQDNVNNRGRIEQSSYRINLNLMSGMNLNGRLAFITIKNSLPTDALVPAMQGNDGKTLPSVEIRGLKIPAIKGAVKRPTSVIVAFDKLIVNREVLSDVVRVFAAKPNGSRGKALFAMHKDYLKHQGVGLSAIVEKLFPELTNFIIAGYHITHPRLHIPYLRWENQLLPIPKKFRKFREIDELHITKMEVNRFLLHTDTGPIEFKVKRDRQGKITGLLIREDGKEWVFDYVVADGVDGSGKPVYRLFRKSQARWPLKWARSSGFTGTIRGPINVWQNEDEDYGQLYIQPLKEPNTKKILKPAQLFRHEKLLEEPIELKFKEGELTSFYFPKSNECIPAKEWELQMHGAIGTYEWKELMEEWGGRLSAIARKEFTGRHKRLYKIVGTDIEDIKAIVDELFMTQISRLAKGEEIEKKQLNATINQFFNNYAWKQIREDFELSETQIRRLRGFYALKMEARKKRHKLTDEDIMKELSLNKGELEELHRLESFIFGSRWQFDETQWQNAGRRPDDDLPRGVGHELTVNGEPLTSQQDEILTQALAKLFEEGRMPDYRITRGPQITSSHASVIPAKAGIQSGTMDSRFHGNDKRKNLLMTPTKEDDTYSMLDPNGELANLNAIKGAKKGTDVYSIPDDTLYKELKAIVSSQNRNDVSLPK